MRKFRFALLAAAAVIFAAAMFATTYLEHNTCVGVNIVSKERFDGYTLIDDPDLIPTILFNGQAVAVDMTTDTIYLSQHIDENSLSYELEGNLEINNGEYLPFFLKDEKFGDIYNAVRENHSFTLYAVTSDREYMQYNVVFTQLPVLKMNGGFYTDKAPGVPRYIGNIWLWDTVENDTNAYTALHSESFWHRRGNPYAKESWKLSLRVNTFEENNLSIMKLGKDEDWILNPLFMDDTNVRERLAMDLWNSIQQEKWYPLEMSAAEYVEVVKDGDYKGLYLMQRRMDRKFLALDENDILYKSLDEVIAADAEHAYEVTYSGQSEELTEQLKLDLFNATIYDHIDIENWIDVALLVQLGCMSDNDNYKNMFFVFSMEADGSYIIYLVPWDTDLSFGLTHTDNPQQLIKRMEYDGLKKLYPDLDKMLAQRWQQLREDIFTMENITGITQGYYGYLEQTGVLQRESERWLGVMETFTGLEQMYSFTQQRLEFLDGYYAQFIE